MAYHWTTDNARNGKLAVVRKQFPYWTRPGYALMHIPSGDTSCAYKFKRGAVAHIQALIDCPNTPPRAQTIYPR